MIRKALTVVVDVLTYTVILGILVEERGLADVQFHTDISGQSIFTSYSLGFPDCDASTVDRRLSVGVMPKGRWSSAEVESSFALENQIVSEDELRPFHRVGTGSVKYRLGHHRVQLGIGYDDSEQVLWGCAASLAARLKREQRIREDLQVAGDRVRTEERSVRYEHEDEGRMVSVFATDIREQGAYGRFQSDLWLTLAARLTSTVTAGMRLGVGDEGIRDEKYRNQRGVTNIAYKPSARWSWSGEFGIQRRGEIQRVSNWESRMDYLFSRHIRMGLASSKILSQRGPRFTTQGYRVSVARVVGPTSTTIDVGRVDVDNPRNANNIVAMTHEDQISPYHRYYLKASEGTEFVAIVRKTRVVEVGYNFAAIQDGSGGNGSALNLGGSYNKTWLDREGRPESEVGILEVHIKGRF